MAFTDLIERMSVLGGLIEDAENELAMLEHVGSSFVGGEGAYAYELDRARMVLRVLRAMHEEACEAV